MANEFLTVRQAQYLLEKLRSEVTVTVDSALSSTSENPVQNKVITNALTGMQNSVQTKLFDQVSIPNASDTTIGNSGSLAAGTYLIIATIQIANNNTGRRALFLATSTSGNPVDRFARVVVAPATGAATHIQLVYLTTLKAATAFYVRAYQSSGGALNGTNGGMAILKLH